MAVSLQSRADQQYDATNPPPEAIIAATTGKPPAMNGSPARVTLAPQPPTAEQRQLSADQARLTQLSAPATPFHQLSPGHKIARVFEDIGNVAGNVFAPSTMALIPGTQLNKERETNQMAKRVNLEQQEESENELRGAQAKNLENETQIRNQEEPGKELLNQSEVGEHNAQAENLGSEAANRDIGGTPELETYRSLVAMGMSSREALQEIERDRQMALKPATVTPEQQFLDEYHRLHPNATVGEAEHAYSLNTQKPPQVLMFSPNGQGGETAQNVRPGTTIVPGAQTAPGVNAVNTPTAQMRTAAGRANMAAQEIPGIVNEVKSLAPELGPIAGRWNEFMQGKVGMDNPQFAGLRSDLIYLSSAVALAHAVGRLPENLREEFDTMINAPQQTPENILTVLNHTQKWMIDNANAMAQVKPLGQTQQADGPYETKDGKKLWVSGGYVYDATR